ncbi:nicotinate-nucleotide--dimethylbenzimidazole phosphoribosyltransferase [Kordia sp.]|uniref:nicotinate-nucleotide--dimethylbenzimidazole phosphoribosyltransferase n=1 Tax=Kordia sp. TaxID=1965332 RepID=UPI0025B7EBA9|nr:nicotinate-nucleotide--dimethylbenzimidazole phosphoribosyltransferase [Kordia sp.]MCH2194825.1 nicotinate-nucleotide--dimethylbenzimidazole phosphoribosyltransferase [Kordia sp.]
MIESTANRELEQQLRHKIDTKTKPIGALGHLETIAFQLGKIQNTVSPSIQKPSIVVFAADHGIAAEGEVNPYPQEVTAQMVYNFLQGGAAINVFSVTNNINLSIVDAGVNHRFEAHPNLLHKKVAFGTKNYKYSAAMTSVECELAMQHGSDIIENLHKQGCNSVGFGEMGIGNTSAASLLMSYITGISIDYCVGAGTGLNTAGIEKKKQVLNEVFKKHTPQTPLEALQCFGGFEIAMMCGAMLKAASLRMVILIDGFIVNAALLIATKIDRNVLDYCIFSHSSNEQGHQKILDYLQVQPLLRLGLRLGEGTGAALAFPLVQAASNFLNNMASFEIANVSEKS